MRPSTRAKLGTGQLRCYQQKNPLRDFFVDTCAPRGMGNTKDRHLVNKMTVFGGPERTECYMILGDALKLRVRLGRYAP
ncbi:MAG: hypothetical protein UU98_C0044G0013 [Parcubacteria group bacterium GW2011_GWD2_42_14]|nr:MAG: hypothetical protein UU98_C0044G0013 [Parcubacteria group bacterium GW2011_GWD2_42_14]